MLMMLLISKSSLNDDILNITNGNSGDDKMAEMILVMLTILMYESMNFMTLNIGKGRNK